MLLERFSPEYRFSFLFSIHVKRSLPCGHQMIEALSALLRVTGNPPGTLDVNDSRPRNSASAPVTLNRWGLRGGGGGGAFSMCSRQNSSTMPVPGYI